MQVTFQAVQLVRESETEACLVFADARFAGVLSRLSEAHDELAGRWFLEFGVGRLACLEAHFANLDDAALWIEDELAA